MPLDALVAPAEPSARPDHAQHAPRESAALWLGKAAWVMFYSITFAILLAPLLAVAWLAKRLLPG